MAWMDSITYDRRKLGVYRQWKNAGGNVEEAVRRGSHREQRIVVAEANQQIAAANGAIGELEALLEPEPEAEKEAE